MTQQPATTKPTAARPGADQLPPVTDEHRRQAFELFKWPGVTFEQAMAVDLRARLIEACAHGIRTREWQASQRAQRASRYSPWCQAAIFGARTRPLPPLPATDNKRRAAHDLDD